MHVNLIIFMKIISFGYWKCVKKNCPNWDFYGNTNVVRVAHDGTRRKMSYSDQKLVNIWSKFKKKYEMLCEKLF